MKNACRALKDMLNNRNYHYDTCNTCQWISQGNDREKSWILNSSINRGWYAWWLFHSSSVNTSSLMCITLSCSSSSLSSTSLLTSSLDEPYEVYWCAQWERVYEKCRSFCVCKCGWVWYQRLTFIIRSVSSLSSYKRRTKCRISWVNAC